jgi:hypothetical protein
VYAAGMVIGATVVGVKVIGRVGNRRRRRGATTTNDCLL